MMYMYNAYISEYIRESRTQLNNHCRN